MSVQHRSFESTSANKKNPHLSGICGILQRSKNSAQKVFRKNSPYFLGLLDRPNSRRTDLLLHLANQLRRGGCCRRARGTLHACLIEGASVLARSLSRLLPPASCLLPPASSLSSVSHTLSYVSCRWRIPTECKCLMPSIPSPATPATGCILPTPQNHALSCRPDLRTVPHVSAHPWLLLRYR